MVGITSYGAYIPFYRIPRAEIAKTWGIAPQGAGERAVANFDEDSLTMAVAACIDCLQGFDRNKVDGFYLASTTSPYAEKMNSTIGAAAIDLKRGIRAQDFSNSLRSGTGAILAAVDAVKAGSMKNVLVAASDLRQAATQGDMEQNLGDGAAAVMLGDTDVIATIDDSCSISLEIMDIWRPAGDTFVRSWEERFGIDEGYNKLVPEAVATLAKKNNLTPQDITKVIYYGPTERRHKAMSRILGLKADQIQDSLISAVGNTGTALPLMMLVAVLEEARPGQKIMLVGYGNGCDAILLTVTNDISKIKDRRGVKGHLASKKNLSTYQKYLTWRGLVPVQPAARPDREPTSAVGVWRELAQNIALYGSKCTSCGAQQYPIQRVCVKCMKKDEYELVRLSDKKANIFTFTADNLAASVDPPAIVGVVNFEGGGRAAFDMTDRDPAEVKTGMDVEFTFRKLYFERGIHNYYWKIRPVR